MATVPITSLTRDDTPPADKSIRAIVTLSWPYSSSTRQCALLLADPDFRLRSRKGQVRVRFTEASAEAVAKSRVGIGDEVVLELNGVSWEQDAEAARTPGKSVDGELVYRRKLSCKIVRADGDVDINVDAPASPPRSPEKAREVATPLPKAVTGLRSSLDGTVGASTSYTYTSPAFVKRLRLSGESFVDSAFDPFTGEDFDEELPNKRQRMSFGSNLKWRYAEKTPSPTKSTHKDIWYSEPGQEAVIPVSDDSRTLSEQRDAASASTMLPPPLPRLQMPSGEHILETAIEQQEGPSTPKLQPVKSPTLPLPSPFPTESASSHFGLLGPAASTQTQSEHPSAELQDRTELFVAEADEHAVPILEDEVVWDHDTMIKGTTMQEYPSDTEPDEDLVRDGDDDYTHNGSSNAVYEDEVDEIIEPDDGERPSDHDSGSELRDDLAQPQHSDDAEQNIQEIHGNSEDDIDAAHSARPQTPGRDTDRDPPNSFGLDGATPAAPSLEVTPQSEKDRIMAQTYRSLFGFKRSTEAAAPALPEEGRQQEQEEEQPKRPTPDAGVSDLTRARFAAAGLPAQEDQKPARISAAEDIFPSEEQSDRDGALKYSHKPASSAPPRPSQTGLIDLGSSSEDEEEDNEQVEEADEESHFESTGVQQQFRSPETQGSLEDLETEDLLDPSIPAGRGKRYRAPTHEDPSMVEHGTAEQKVVEHISVRHQNAKQSQEMDIAMPDEVHDDTASMRSDSILTAERPQALEDRSASLSPEVQEAITPPLSSVPASQSVADRAAAQSHEPDYGTQPPKSTAATTVIDVGSSSSTKRAATSPPVETAAAGDFVESHFEPEELGSQLREEVAEAVSNEVEVLAEVKSSTSDVEAGTHSSPTQSRIRDAQSPPINVSAPMYPSLPLSPSNSQSLQDMPSQTAVESLLPATVRSALPPTPQLTQQESSAQLPVQVEREASASQQTQLEASSQSQEPVDEPRMPSTRSRTSARKVLASRLSNVPDVISAWFSPKRSSGIAGEHVQHEHEQEIGGRDNGKLERTEKQQANGAIHTSLNGHAITDHEITLLEDADANGLSTSLAYFTPLSKLESLLNPSSQQLYGSNNVDVFAVVFDETKEPARARAGPRDFFTIFRVCDTSLSAPFSTRVEIFRPWLATLPVAQVGDIVLLRAFAVKSRKRQAYLLSTDASSWCVWRHGDSAMSQDNKDKLIWAQKGSGTSGTAVREEIKGPPVEMGEEERKHAQSLREWWQALHGGKEQQDDSGETKNTEMNGNSSQFLTAKL